MIVLLVITFVIIYFLINESKGSKDYFFNLPFIVSTPPLVGLIYFGIISKFNFVGKDGARYIVPIFNEISLIYVKALLCFSLLIYIIRSHTRINLIARDQSLPNTKESLTILLVFYLTEKIISAFNPSIHLLILFSELTNLSLILFITTLIINFRLNKSIYGFLLIGFLSTITFFIFTFDKGSLITLFSSIFLILLGSKKLNIKINAIKINLLILMGGFLLPFLNFIEEYFFKNRSGAFNALTEVMESSMFQNYFHIFYNPNCNYDQSISIINSVFSPLRAILGLEMNIHQHDFMEACFPVQRALGQGKGFGLINESLLSNELPSYLYFSICAIIFILIIEYFYFRFSLLGLLVYSQSIELVYKLTRSDSISSLFTLLYIIIASLIIYLSILFLKHNFNVYKE